MTKDETLKLALEALERINDRFDLESVAQDATKAITALEKALAQPEQEPVAINLLRYEPEIFREDRIRMEIDCSGDWVKYADVAALIAQSPQPAPVQQEPVKLDRTGMTYYKNYKCKALNSANHDCICWTPSAQPPQRKPLTDEQIETIWRRVQTNDFHDCVQPFARAIEAAHGIKE